MDHAGITSAEIKTWETRLGVSREEVLGVCHRWGISEFAFFGSILRDDFNANSDVDVLIRLDHSKPRKPWDWIDIIEELQQKFGRKVDLVSADQLDNPFFRRVVLAEREVVYVG